MKKQLLSIFSILTIGSAFAQIPNNGMELWGSAGFGEQQGPMSYVSANFFTSPFVNVANPTSVTQGTGVNAFAGTYSAKITTVKLVTNPATGTIPDTVGVLMLGTVSLAGTPPLKSGTPWTTRLNSIDFYYKYTPVNGDNGGMIAYMTKWNGTSRDTLATAAYPVVSTVSSFTQASGPFINNPNFAANVLPDSLHVYFLSSARPWVNSASTPNPAQVGSSLWVDEATVTTVGLKETYKLGQSISVYPNPATNFINISSGNDEAVSVELFDIAGNKVLSGLFDDKKVRLETASLAEGLYIYSVKNKQEKVISSGKVNITK